MNETVSFDGLLTERLQQAIDQLGISVTPAQFDQLVAYAELFHKWNQTYNLSSVRTLPLIVDRHLIDALSIIDAIKGYSHQRIADIGTGGGLPGIVLAIMCPDSLVYLVESVGKKCRFLRQVCSSLSLSNAEVCQVRVEQWQPALPCDIIVSRAFASLDKFIRLTRHLGGEHSKWLAMKSEQIDEELEQIVDSKVQIEKNERLVVPFEVAKRRLVTLTLQE